MGYIFKVQGEEETKKPKETKPTDKNTAIVKYHW